MSEIITKDLLSMVLNEEVVSSEQVSLSEINIGFKDNTADSINIYELAHKCKEWAYKVILKHKLIPYIKAGMDNYTKPLKVESGKSKYDTTLYRRQVSKPENGEYYYCSFTIFDADLEHYFTAKSAPEAIFKACQWILSNKD